jgi:hypothetical protein
MTRLPLVGPDREPALKELSRDPLDAFPKFVDAVRSRLADDQKAYGDESFSRPVDELIGEIEEEMLDLAGWGFILWTRLQRVKSRLAPVAIHEDM